VIVGGDSGLIFKNGNITAASSGTFIAKVSNKDISNETPQPLSAKMDDVAAYQASLPNREKHHQQFEFVNALTGKPVKNLDYQIENEDGVIKTLDKTNKSGMSWVLNGAKSQTLKTKTNKENK